jgi:hypothetical protein
MPPAEGATTAKAVALQQQMPPEEGATTAKAVALKASSLSNLQQQMQEQASIDIVP